MRWSVVWSFVSRVSSRWVSLLVIVAVTSVVNCFRCSLVLLGIVLLLSVVVVIVFYSCFVTKIGLLIVVCVFRWCVCVVILLVLVWDMLFMWMVVCVCAIWDSTLLLLSGSWVLSGIVLFSCF